MSSICDAESRHQVISICFITLECKILHKPKQNFEKGECLKSSTFLSQNASIKHLLQIHYQLQHALDVSLLKHVSFGISNKFQSHHQLQDALADVQCAGF